MRTFLNPTHTGKLFVAFLGCISLLALFPLVSAQDAYCKARKLRGSERVWYVRHIVHPKTFRACDCLAGILYKGCQKSWQAVAMAAGPSEAASASREFFRDDLGDLWEALHKVSMKYTFFGLQIGLKMHEIHGIAEKHSDSAHCLLEILSARLNQESALTCADIVKALRSPSVSEHSLAIEFQNQFENIIHKGQIEREKVSSEKEKAAKFTESEIRPKMTQSKRIEELKSGDESKSDENEKAEKSAEVERQLHEKNEPKSKRAKKRARKKERAVKSLFASEQPDLGSAIQLRMSKKESERSKIIEYVESEDESKSDESENIQKAVKSAVIERQVHERDEPKSKRAKKRAHKREKNRCASEQPEPDEYKEDERKQMKGKQKQKIQFSEMAASPQSGAEYDQKRKKSVKESDKIAPEIMSTDSENESSDACKEKEILSTKSEKTGKVRGCGAYSEVKHQPQSAKIREVKNEKRKKGKIPEKEGSTKQQHSVLHRKTAVAVESDEGTSERPSHKSKKKLEAEETESEESFSESTSDESETESPKHKLKVKPKSPTDAEEMYHDSDEEIEKVRAKDKKKMPQKSKVATAKSSPHSERLVEEEQYKQKKGKRSVDVKEQERLKGERESESDSMKYDTARDDEQSDPGHGSRHQEEHDIQQKRRKKKKQRRESSMSPTAIGSSSPSTSQEEKKKQPVSKKQGHRKKHVRKMKEKRERMKRGKEKAARSSGTDDSSPDCDMTKNQYEGEMKQLVNIFQLFFGKLCCVAFDPKDVAAKLQKKGLISKAMMRDMMLSPESQQAKIIALIDALDEMIKFRPDCLFVVIEVMLENEALQETAREILRETGTQCLVCTLHFVLDSKTLFPTGRVCPVETAAKFPSQVLPSDTAVPSTADTLSPTDKSMLNDLS